MGLDSIHYFQTLDRDPLRRAASTAGIHRRFKDVLKIYIIIRNSNVLYTPMKIQFKQTANAA